MLKEINILGTKKKVIVARFDKSTIAIMKPIDEKIEDHINKLNPYDAGKEFVDKNRIYIYGEVDLNNDEDCKLIKNLFPMHDSIMGNQIHANFDYETGTVSPIDGNIRWTIEVDPFKWFKYNYCLIGKPKRIIVYKTSISFI